jgi:Domain of Unknown Function (DUF1080)
VAEYADPDASSRSGAIALACAADTTVRYQAITIEEVPDLAPESVGLGASSGGWKPLFNGKDLTEFDIGWPAEHRWSVVDGTIVSAGPKSFTVLHTKRHYSDFHLRFETMVPEGVAGSVDIRHKKPGFFYAVALAGTAPGYGAQKTGNVQLWTDNKRAEVATASDPLAPLGPGRWFPMEIIADGDTVRVIVQGQEVSRYTDTKRTYTSGPIGLFCRPHATMRFRNLQVKELSVVIGEPPSPAVEGP